MSNKLRLKRLLSNLLALFLVKSLQLIFGIPVTAAVDIQGEQLSILFPKNIENLNYTLVIP